KRHCPRRSDYPYMSLAIPTVVSRRLLAPRFSKETHGTLLGLGVVADTAGAVSRVVGWHHQLRCWLRYTSDFSRAGRCWLPTCNCANVQRNGPSRCWFFWHLGLSTGTSRSR